MGKKKGKNNGATKQTPEQHIKTRMRTLPIAKCLINTDWQEGGLAMIVVVRQHKQGSQSAGFYLVDTKCLGVKDSFFRFNLDPEELQETIDLYSDDVEMIEEKYEVVHNIIYGAIAFAEEGGIEPCKEFKITEYFLEEDDDNIPLIDYEFGEDGLHMLVVNSRLELSKYLPILRQNLEEDEIDFMVMDDDDDDTYSNPFLNEDYAKSEYTYVHPDYPSELKIKNQWIFDELNSKQLVPDDACIDRILALPKDEARQDLEAIIYYALALTADNPDNEDIEYPLISNCIMLLGEVGNLSSLDVILETMCQNPDWYEVFICDAGNDIYTDTLFQFGPEAIDKLLEFLYRRGIHHFVKCHVAMTLAMIAKDQPEYRERIIEGLHKYLQAAKDDLQTCSITDGETIALIICSCMDINAEELLPEIKELYDTELISEGVCGDYESIEREIGLEMTTLQIADRDIKTRFHNLVDTFDY